MNDRLYRSRDDRVVAGVAGGLAERLDADPSLLRILWVVLVIFSGGIALLVYLVMAIVVPEEDVVYPQGRPAAPGGIAAPNGSTGWSEGATPWTPATSTAGMTRLEARRARRAARRAARNGRDGRVGAAVGGTVLILLGSWFLLREWWPGIDFDWFWPAILIAVGVLIAVMSLARGAEEPGGAP